ncbi:MAG: helix-turn-helix transcriptional regulator [Clostridiales bacterium]|nr:helix-turn-helix transcriptional regulator [Clostridiales bacterium]
MIFPDKLRALRKSKGYTQEELAERLGLSRQAIAKYESGQGYPDIGNLIGMSELFNVTVDWLVKDGDCEAGASAEELPQDLSELIGFRLLANRNTYAGFSNETDPSRPDSHDFRFDQGDYTYIDTYLGGERFAGEEAVWKNGKAVYAMNYAGRVLDQRFSGNFLKAALRAADPKMPYRGPSHFTDGEYTYTATVEGDITWFQGYEEISCRSDKVYECYFHGGLVK